MLERLAGPLTRRWAWARTVLTVQQRFSEIHGSSLAAAVTLVSFISVFPLLLVAIACLGFVMENSIGFATRVVGTLGLSGDSARIVTEALEQARESKRAASIIGLGGLVWSGLGLSSAMQRVFDTVWQVQSAGLRDRMRGAAWLMGAAVLLAASFAVAAVLRRWPLLAPVAVAVGLGVNLALWQWTHRWLTRVRVGWRDVLPGAIVGAVGLAVLQVAAGFYLPRAVASSAALYGSLGAVFAVLAWLFFFGRLLVYSVITNVVVWEARNGTVTVEIELPKHLDRIATSATRAGEAVPVDATEPTATA